MNRQNDYILQRKKWGDLNSSLRMCGTSEPPEMQLENMWEVVSRSTGEKLEMVEPDFSEFSASDRMYPSMMKPDVKKRWDMKKQEWEDQKDKYQRIERMARAQFLLDNPDLPLVRDLAKTNYGQELIGEYGHGAVQRRRTMELDTRRVSNPEAHVLKEDRGKLLNNIELLSSKVGLDNLEGAEYYWTVHPRSGACVGRMPQRHVARNGYGMTTYVKMFLRFVRSNWLAILLLAVYHIYGYSQSRELYNSFWVRLFFTSFVLVFSELGINKNVSILLSFLGRICVLYLVLIGIQYLDTWLAPLFVQNVFDTWLIEKMLYAIDLINGVFPIIEEDFSDEFFTWVVFAISGMIIQSFLFALFSLPIFMAVNMKLVKLRTVKFSLYMIPIKFLILIVFFALCSVFIVIAARSGNTLFYSICAMVPVTFVPLLSFVMGKIEYENGLKAEL